jgi:hypothetical protein
MAWSYERSASRLKSRAIITLTRILTLAKHMSQGCPYKDAEECSTCETNLASF